MNFTNRHLVFVCFVLAVILGVIYFIAVNKQSLITYVQEAKSNKDANDPQKAVENKKQGSNTVSIQTQKPIEKKPSDANAKPQGQSQLIDEDFPPSEGDTLKGISRNTKRTLAFVDLKDTSPPALIENTYYALLYNNDGTCEKNYHLGDPLDGSYRICDDPPYSLKTGDCIVYSFGINNMWTFDDAVAEKFKCKIFAFDPVMKKAEHMRGTNIHYYPIGLGGEDTDKFMGNLKLLTLKNIIKMLGHENKVIDILKIDIEYSEWVSFEKAIADNAMDNVVQLVFESHTVLTQSKEMVNRYKILHKIHEIGFRQWGFRDNIVTPTLRSPYTGKFLICCVDHFFIKKRK